MQGSARKFKSKRDVQGIHSYNVAREDYLELLEKQELYWKQWAKQFWLREGDQNTEFFHKYTSTRRKHNYLDRIKGEDGEWRDTNEGIQEVVEKYFKTLFQSMSYNGRLRQHEEVQKITEVENEALLSNITTEEVKETTVSMHMDKSSGKDGLNPAFYQFCWNIVGSDVVRFYQTFLRIGELLDGINNMVVCLIPKKTLTQTMQDLRPISLCNMLVRIQSKVISNRLKPFLKNIISKKQSVFIEGRLLTDNALVTFEINQYMKRRMQG